MHMNGVQADCVCVLVWYVHTCMLLYAVVHPLDRIERACLYSDRGTGMNEINLR
jgi:hypothetical protein